MSHHEELAAKSDHDITVIEMWPLNSPELNLSPPK